MVLNLLILIPPWHQLILFFFGEARAAQEIFTDLQSCVGVDLSEDMLTIAEQLQGKLTCLVAKIQRKSDSICSALMI